MKELKFMRLADAVAQYSKDPSTKVGAVIIDNDMNVLATGWNGFARGIEDSPERLWNRELKLRLMVHAEMNALLASARTGRKLDGATMLVSSLYPCEDCASAIIQAGIKRVIAPRITGEKAHWLNSNTFAKALFDEAGVEVIEVD